MKQGLEAIDYSLRTGDKIYYKGDPVVALAYHRENDNYKVELLWLSYWEVVGQDRFVNDFGYEVSPEYKIDNKRTLEYLDNKDLKNFKKQKMMKKQDLKNGYLLEHKAGYLVLHIDGYVFYKEGEHDNLDTIYNDNLECISIHNEDGRRDVSAIYDLSNAKGLWFKPYYWEKVRRKGEDKIWQREDEKTELTLQEIANKFDIPVKQLRIKE